MYAYSDRQTDRQQTDRQGIFSIPQGRIEWIDIAKAIAIVSVMIGHTVKYGSSTLNVICSFHMPIFFLLSGYTYHIANSCEIFCNHLKKGFKHLLLPGIIVFFISSIYAWLIGNVQNVDSFWQTIKRMCDALWWASGIGVHGHMGIGPIWFLFSLFWAKVLMDIINLMFPGKYTGYIYGFIGLIGMALGTKGKWLPQNLDVTFVAIFFIYIGMLWKEHHQFIEKYMHAFFLAAVSIWIICLCYNNYIEMSGRHYPLLIISMIEATCGSFAICCLCRAVSQNVYVRKITLFIGIHTLLILLVHCLDWIIMPLWQTSSYSLNCLTRVFTVLSISFFVHIIRFYWKNINVLR